MRRIKWALAAVGPLLCLTLCACGLFGTRPFAQSAAQGLEKAVIQRMSTQGLAEFTDEKSLSELSAFLENLTVYGQTDPDGGDPTLIFVLYWRDGTVQALLTAGGMLEIDGACYRAGAGDCRALNALGWSLLFP